MPPSSSAAASLRSVSQATPAAAIPVSTSSSAVHEPSSTMRTPTRRVTRSRDAERHATPVRRDAPRVVVLADHHGRRRGPERQRVEAAHARPHAGERVRDDSREWRRARRGLGSTGRPRRAEPAQRVRRGNGASDHVRASSRGRDGRATALACRLTTCEGLPGAHRRHQADDGPHGRRHLWRGGVRGHPGGPAARRSELSIAPGLAALGLMVVLLVAGTRLPSWALAALGPIGVALIGYALATTAGRRGCGGALHVAGAVGRVLLRAHRQRPDRRLGRRGPRARADRAARGRGQPGSLAGRDGVRERRGGRRVRAVAEQPEASCPAGRRGARGPAHRRAQPARLRGAPRGGAGPGAPRAGVDGRRDVRHRPLQAGSTTSSATRSATRCSPTWARCSPRRPAPPTWWPGRAARSSWRCSRARTGKARVAYAERVRAAFAAPGGARPSPVTVSAGVTAEQRPATPEQLLHDSDSALYAAKRAGRDRTVVGRRARRRTPRRVARPPLADGPASRLRRCPQPPRTAPPPRPDGSLRRTSSSRRSCSTATAWPTAPPAADRRSCWCTASPPTPPPGSGRCPTWPPASP